MCGVVGPGGLGSCSVFTGRCCGDEVREVAVEEMVAEEGVVATYDGVLWMTSEGSVGTGREEIEGSEWIGAGRDEGDEMVGIENVVRLVAFVQ